MTTRHTPGPWKLEKTEPGDIIVNPDCRKISGVGWECFAIVVTKMLGDEFDEPEGVANARLIAAAPELLAAVKAQHEAIDMLMARLIVRDPAFLPSKSVAWPAVVAGHAAIAKAEGRDGAE